MLLLDEIEKAHPDLFNILLQVMDHGKLTDHNGKTVDFRNVILIMTTNAGASDMAKEAIGFGREAREGEDEDAIKRLFTPEFRNRLDAIIAFAGLTPEIVGRVVEKFVMQLEAQLADRNVTIELSSAAKEWLAERGYDRLYGARPLARVIQEHIKKPLAEELLFGKLVKGGAVKVTLKDGKLDFEIIEASVPALPKPEDDGDGGRTASRKSRSDQGSMTAPGSPGSGRYTATARNDWNALAPGLTCSRSAPAGTAPARYTPSMRTSDEKNSSSSSARRSGACSGWPSTSHRNWVAVNSPSTM